MAIALVSASPCVVAGMPFYIAAPIDARVVDAETGQPVEGATVVANWQLVTGSLAGGERARGQLEVKETVTDKQGRFHFDGFARFNFSFNELRNQDPQILIFKSGYEFKRIVNFYGMTEPIVIGPRRKSQVDGKEIQLKKLTEDPAKSKNIAYLGLQVYIAPIVNDCEWRRIPNAILSMDRERRRITEANPSVLVDIPGLFEVEATSKDCGSSVEFFKEYK